MKVRTKAVRRIAVVATAIAMLIVGMTTSAQGAVTAMTVTPTDPTPGTATTWTIGGTGFNATATCVEINVFTDSALTTPIAATPTNIVVTGGTYGTKNYAAGKAAANGSAGAVTAVAVSLTNPAAGSYYVRYRSTNGTATAGVCSGTVIDSANSAVAITASTTVQVNVDSAFTFNVTAIAAGANACNAETSTVNGHATSINLGTLSGTAVSAANQLEITTNAASGYDVNFAVTPMADTATGTKRFDNAGGTTVAWPNGGTNGAYGVNFTGQGTNYKMVGAANVTGTVLNNPSSTGAQVNGCVLFKAEKGSATSAGIYQSVATYTAIPKY